MATDSSPIVEFTGVSLSYGDTPALKNVSVTLRPGETRIILGEAGSGKTSILKAVIGLIEVDQGQIRLFGKDIRSCTEEQLYPIRARAGILFQEGGLFDSMKIGENVEYPLVNQVGKERPPQDEVDRKVIDSLRFVELDQSIDKFPSEVSGGMRRRVGIARAIVTEPPLVLYDSPTAGLDPITANTIMAVIAKERDVRNTAALIVTYRYQDGELMANFRFDPQKEELVPVSEDEHGDPAKTRTKFLVMRKGEIVFEGTRQQIEASKDDYVKRFVMHEGNNGR